MRFLKFRSPFQAVRDLRTFLATRRRHEWLMLLPALAITGTLVYMFYLDYRFEQPYKRNIIYVESWPLTRGDPEIRAAQRTDLENKKRQHAELKILQKQQQLQFKKVDDWLTQHGI